MFIHSLHAGWSYEILVIVAPHIGPEHRETHPGKSEIERERERERESEGQ